MSSLEEQIRAAYLIERKQQRVATSAHDIPLSFEAITPEWLTAVLCKKHPTARVIDRELGPRDSGTSNRRRIKLRYNEEGEGSCLPKSVFCKASQDLANRLISGHSGGIHCEVTFYNDVRDRLSIEAPRCFLAVYDPISFNSIIVLDDLTGRVEYCSHDTNLSRKLAESQMDLLANVHGKFCDSVELTTTLSGLPTWKQRFDNLASFKLEECCANGFRNSESFIPKRLFDQAERIWPATLASVDKHQLLPQTLNHGDVHLKNWYITPNGMGLGDWQVACRGHWSRDVAYTISTALPVEDRRNAEKTLLQHYLERLHTAGGTAIAFDDAWRNYRQQLFSALALWTLTLTPSAEMPDMQPKDTTIEFIKRIAHAIDDLEALDSFG
jgi:thiamine kinase-like enzyme